MPHPRTPADSRSAKSARDVLLILRPPPPYGGGEIVGALLQRLFTGTFAILAFHRPHHHRASQGRLSFGNVWFGIRYVTRCTTRLIRDRPRVVYLDIPKDTTSFLRSSVVIVAANILGIRVVGDLAGGDFLFLRRGRATRRYGRWILNSVYAIRVLGESVASTLTANGIHNAVVISNGIDEPPGVNNATSTYTSGDERHFLYVGKIAYAKGISTLIDFVDDFRAEGTPFQLHIVGEWENERTSSEIKRQLVDRGIADLVVLHGRLVDDAKWEIYRSAHLLLHPTHWDGQPVVILEALAYGIPVVATRIGAIPDTITSGCEGYLMADNSAAQLIVGVNEIMLDEQTYSDFRYRARTAFQERFAATVFRTRMRTLLELAASDRAVPERDRAVAGAE